MNPWRQSLLLCLKRSTLLVLFFLPGCFLLLPVDDRPCPCSDGYQCCEGVCIANDEDCEPHEKTDGGLVTDAGFEGDAGLNMDGGAPEDSGLRADSGLPADGGASTDAGVSPDGGPVMDAGAGFDGGLMTPDGGQEPMSDSGSIIDAGAIVDGGQNQDAGDLLDGGNCIDVNLLVDSDNCGACGISCASGQCNYGICVPIQFMAGEGTAQGGSHLALVDTKLYYSSQYHAWVYRIELTEEDEGELILEKGNGIVGDAKWPIAATSTHVAAVWSYTSGKDTISVLRHADDSGVRDDIESETIDIFFTQTPIFSANRMIWGDDQNLRFIALGESSNTSPVAVNHEGYVQGLLPGPNGAVYSLGLLPGGPLSLNKWEWSGTTYASDPVLPFPDNQNLVTAQSATDDHLFWGTSNNENEIQLQIVSISAAESLWTLQSEVFPTPVGSGVFSITAIAANHEQVFVAVEDTSRFLILQHSLDPQMVSTPLRIIYTVETSFANIFSMVLSDDHLYFVQKEGQTTVAPVNIWRMEIPPL